MPGQRSKEKTRIEGFILTRLYDRVRSIAGPRTNTDVITEALGEWADKHAPDTTQTTQEQQWPTSTSPPSTRTTGPPSCTSGA